jgi:hypothetical protein
MVADIEADRLDEQAASLESKADEIDVEQHVYFNPRRQFYWNAEERAENYRAKARQLRAQAAEIRRRSA